MNSRLPVLAPDDRGPGCFGALIALLIFLAVALLFWGLPWWVARFATFEVF